MPISAENSGQAGGISGIAIESEINSCSNKGSISGGSRAAGICASSAGSTFRNCINSGEIMGKEYVRWSMWN